MKSFVKYFFLILKLLVTVKSFSQENFYFPEKAENKLKILRPNPNLNYLKYDSFSDFCLILINDEICLFNLNKLTRKIVYKLEKKYSLIYFGIVHNKIIISCKLTNKSTNEDICSKIDFYNLYNLKKIFTYSENQAIKKTELSDKVSKHRNRLFANIIFSPSMKYFMLYGGDSARIFNSLNFQLVNTISTEDKFSSGSFNYLESSINDDILLYSPSSHAGNWLTIALDFSKNNDKTCRNEFLTVYNESKFNLGDDFLKKMGVEVNTLDNNASIKLIGDPNLLLIEQIDTFNFCEHKIANTENYMTNNFKKLSKIILGVVDLKKKTKFTLDTLCGYSFSSIWYSEKLENITYLVITYSNNNSRVWDLNKIKIIKSFENKDYNTTKFYNSPDKKNLIYLNDNCIKVYNPKANVDLLNINIKEIEEFGLNANETLYFIVNKGIFKLYSNINNKLIMSSTETKKQIKSASFINKNWICLTTFNNKILFMNTKYKKIYNTSNKIRLVKI